MKAMLVLCGGEVVGELSEELPDHEYLEGRFAASGTVAGARFSARASMLDPRAAMADPTRAIRVRLAEKLTDTGTTFVVMSLADGRLFGMFVFSDAAVDWAEKNIPE